MVKNQEIWKKNPLFLENGLNWERNGEIQV